MNESTREAYLHDVPLGEPMTVQEFNELLSQQPEHPILLACLQMLRNAAAEFQKASTLPPVERDARDYRAYPDGLAAGVEEVFWGICGARFAKISESEASQ